MSRLVTHDKGMSSNTKDTQSSQYARIDFLEIAEQKRNLRRDAARAYGKTRSAQTKTALVDAEQAVRESEDRIRHRATIQKAKNTIVRQMNALNQRAQSYTPLGLITQETADWLGSAEQTAGGFVDVDRSLRDAPGAHNYPEHYVATMHVNPTVVSVLDSETICEWIRSELWGLTAAPLTPYDDEYSAGAASAMEALAERVTSLISRLHAIEVYTAEAE